jgi:hypothetical protein
MKYKITGIAFLMLILFSACENELEKQLAFKVIVAPAANVQITDSVITAPKGTTLQFDFTGDPDFISFSYNRFNATKSTLTFSTQPAWGTHIENTLKVFLAETTDTLLLTNAKQDSAAIANRQWKDITALCNLPTTANLTKKATVSLNEYRGKKVCIAFQYKTEFAADWQPTWTISSLQINDTLINTNAKVATTLAGAMGFKPFDMLNLTNAYSSADLAGVWNVANTAAIVMKRTASGSALNNDWLVSKPVEIAKGVNTISTVTPVKNTTASVSSYAYPFSVSGEYVVTFTASNQNYLYEESVEKKIKVVITD